MQVKYKQNPVQMYKQLENCPKLSEKDAFKNLTVISSYTLLPIDTYCQHELIRDELCLFLAFSYCKNIKTTTSAIEPYF